MADGGGGSPQPLVLPHPPRPQGRRPHAHVGSGDGSLARDRGRLRDAAGARLVPALRPGAARGHRRRGDRHPRHPERAAPADRARPLRPRPPAARRSRPRGERRPDALLHPVHRFPVGPAAAGPREVPRAVPRDPRRAPPRARRPRRRSVARIGAGGARAAGAPRALARRRCGASSRRARSRTSTSARASGSRTSTSPTSAISRRSCRASSPTPPPARARRASTASSSTSRTPTRWLRSSRARTRGPTATGRRSRAASACRSRCSRPSATGSGPTRASGLRYLGDEVIAGGSRIEDAVFFGMQFARAGRRLPLDLEGRQVRRREAAQGRRGGLSLHRPVRLRVHADRRLRRARPVRPQREPRRRDPHRRAQDRLPDADRDLGRDHDLRAGRGDPRARRSRCRRRGPPVARRSRLVPEDRDRPRRRDPPLHVHELLRGARPEARRGHVQALGPRLRPRRSPAPAPGLIRRQAEAGRAG